MRTRWLFFAAALSLNSLAAAQTRDSLVSSRVDSVPVTVWQKTFTNVYVQVPVPVPPDTVKPPPSGGGNLFSDGFESGQPAGTTLTVSSGKLTFPVDATAYRGSHVMDISTPSCACDGGSRLNVTVAYSPDLWVTFAWRAITLPSSGIRDQKTVMFRAAGNLMGQFNQFSGGKWIWAFISGDGSQTTLSALFTLDVNVWHTVKIHLQQSNNGHRTVTVGGDGSFPLFTRDEPTGVDKAINEVNLGGTLNAGSGASHFQFDNVKIGTTDPGWP